MDPLKTPKTPFRLRRHAALHAEGDNDDMFYSCADCGCSYCLSDLDGEGEAGRAPQRTDCGDKHGKRLPGR